MAEEQNPRVMYIKGISLEQLYERLNEFLDKNPRYHFRTVTHERVIGEYPQYTAWLDWCST